jgi:hypothetical protein
MYALLNAKAAGFAPIALMVAFGVEARQYKYTNVKIFPLDMIAKRLEANEEFRVVERYEALCEGVDEMIEELLADD